MVVAMPTKMHIQISSLTFVIPSSQCTSWRRGGMTMKCELQPKEEITRLFPEPRPREELQPRGDPELQDLIIFLISPSNIAIALQLQSLGILLGQLNTLNSTAEAPPCRVPRSPVTSTSSAPLHILHSMCCRYGDRKPTKHLSV